MGTSAEPQCVYCRAKPVDPDWRPFCSARCKMADLGRWLTGGYAVPAEARGPADADEPDDESPER